jgi:hypothetical protein
MHPAENMTLGQVITSDDIRRNWSKFDDEELAAIKKPADLVLQIQAQYGLDPQQALHAVEEWTKDHCFQWRLSNHGLAEELEPAVFG